MRARKPATTAPDQLNIFAAGPAQAPITIIIPAPAGPPAQVIQFPAPVAVEEATQEATQEAHEAPPPPTGGGLSPEAAAYLAALARRNASPRTIKSYRLELARIERVTKKPLAALTHMDLDGFLNWLAARKVRACTLNKALITFRSFSKWAIKMELIARDPAAKLDKAREEARLPKVPTEADVRDLFDTLSWDITPTGRRNLAMMACLYYLGARASEVTGLDVSDFDMATGRVRLYGKGRKERIVPVSAKLAEYLRAWLAAHPTKDGALFVDLRKRHFARRLTYDGLRAVFNAAMRAAGLGKRGYTPHKLRHAYACALLRAGISLDKIQKLLGHSSVSTTQGYARTELGEDIGGLVEGALG